MGMISNLKHSKKLKPPRRRTKTRPFSFFLYSPTQDRYYEYDRKKIRVVEKPNPKSKLISFITLEDVISETVEINGVLEGEELYHAIELKLFSELSLDSSHEYKICFDEIKSQETSRTHKSYNAYATAHQTISARLSAIKESYIDFVFTPQTAVKTLFTKNILKSSSTFAFIYLYQESAYLCVYQNGDLAYSKPIRSSFVAMTKRFSEILGERVDAEEMIKLLVDADERNKKPEYAAAIKALLAEFFASVSDVLVHAKRVNQIGEYEAIFVGTERGSIAGISKIAKEFFETPFRDFEFNLGFYTDGFVDISTRLMIFAFLNDSKNYEYLNFSIFKRPPPLFKRAAGRFLAIFALSFFASCSYPLYNIALANSHYSRQIKTLSTELSELEPAKSKIENRLTIAQETQKRLLEQIARTDSEHADTIKALQGLSDAKSEKESVTMRLIKLSSAVSNSNVQIKTLEIKEEQNSSNEVKAKIVCAAKAPHDITEFAKKYWLITNLKTTADAIYKDGGGANFIGEISVLDVIK